MKRIMTVLTALITAIVLTSCGILPLYNNRSERQVFQVPGYDVWITTPRGWQETDPESLDLQCSSLEWGMYMSVFGFYKMDLAQGESVQILFEAQNDFIMSETEYAQEVEPVSIRKEVDKTIYYALYSGEIEGSKNYFSIFLVEFQDTDDMAWIMFNGMPSSVEEYREAIASIVLDVQNSEPGADRQQKGDII